LRFRFDDVVADRVVPGRKFGFIGWGQRYQFAALPDPGLTLLEQEIEGPRPYFVIDLSGRSSCDRLKMRLPVEPFLADENDGHDI
jgi:hypothetical protein